jgi:hypothetical protein
MLHKTPQILCIDIVYKPALISVSFMQRLHSIRQYKKIVILTVYCDTKHGVMTAVKSIKIYVGEEKYS